MRFFLFILISVALANAISISSNPELSEGLKSKVQSINPREEERQSEKYEGRLRSEMNEPQFSSQESQFQQQEYSLNENPEEFFFSNRLVKSFLHEPVDLEWIYHQSEQSITEQQQQQQQQVGQQRSEANLTRQLMIPINEKLENLLECYRNQYQKEQVQPLGEQGQQTLQSGGGQNVHEPLEMMHRPEPTRMTESLFEQNPEKPCYLYVVVPIRISPNRTESTQQQNIQSSTRNF